MPTLSVIIPCYYNEENLKVTLPTVAAIGEELPADTELEYVLVDDGSKDNTWAEILKWQEQHPDKVHAVKLSGNFGAYNAILAGMHYATGEANVVLTADMQDPPELIPKMYEYWQKGIKMVLANRTDREEPFMQKLFSNTFHNMMKRYALKHIPKGGFDLVMFDEQLRDEVVNMNERNAHTLYLLAWMKYEYVAIPYTRKKREIGKSRCDLRKKVKLLIDSFVSFSFMPIRAITAMGFILGTLALLYGIFIIVARLTDIVDVRGWSSMMIVILVVASFQMFALGIIGEYVWRALDAARGRPNFFVDKLIQPKKEDN